MKPDVERMAIHQAGHAVVQAWVGRGRFEVSRVALDGPHGARWRGRPAQGEAVLDRETFLGLYEFGLVTLAGIAAENRYLADQEPEEEPIVALSDIAEWQEQALNVLGNEEQVHLVSLNVMRKLEEVFSDPGIWRVTEQLAEKLVAEGAVQGETLQNILGLLAKPEESSE